MDSLPTYSPWVAAAIRSAIFSHLRSCPLARLVPEFPGLPDGFVIERFVLMRLDGDELVCPDCDARLRLGLFMDAANGRRN